MEPTNSSPQFSPEHAPVAPTSFPEITRNEHLDVSPERPAERMEQSPLAASEVATAAAPQVVPTVVAPVTPVDDAVSVNSMSDVPILAGDEDLIEKEWVDKAKRIIAATANDPYVREQQINQLQREYLRKRYGKELGDAA